MSDRRPGAVLAVALALVVTACGSSTPPAAAPGSSPSAGASGSTPAGSTSGSPGTTGPTATYPGAQWATADPAALGFDPAQLGAIADQAQQAGSNCLLVTRHGELVDEWYWNGTAADTAQEVFSATKSYTSALVGIAQDQGKLAISDLASKYIPSWAGTPSGTITVQNLLRNDSGRHWDFNTDYVQMAARAPDKTAFAVGLGQDAPPGQVWVYNNSAIQTISEVLHQAIGGDVAAFAHDQLLGPIGMDHSEMTKDQAGNTLTFEGLHSTCRDMARFGYLFLRQGDWAGRQVVPSAWVAESTGQSSQKLNAAYGYLWWLNRRGHVASPTAPSTGATGGDTDGQLTPGAPDDMYWAIGLGNQIIQVDPGSDTVVVRLGPINTPAGAPRFGPANTAQVATKALVRP